MGVAPLAPRSTWLGLALPLGLIVFWCALAMAAHAYPGGYDWRYQTISVLLYPDQNPAGYRWGWAALELCGLLGIAWIADLRLRIGRVAPGAAVGVLWSLQLGFVCMCCAVLPDRLLVPKAHEALVIAAFLAICLGMARGLFLTQYSRNESRPRRAVAPLRAWFLAAIPFVPLLLAGLTQIYLTLERPSLPWVGPAWRTLGVPPYLSFALWEWVSCTLFSLCLLMLWHADIIRWGNAPRR